MSDLLVLLVGTAVVVGLAWYVTRRLSRLQKYTEQERKGPTTLGRWIDDEEEK